MLDESAEHTPVERRQHEIPIDDDLAGQHQRLRIKAG
jgi:hypothetical protein